jgi:urease accessory protein
MIPSALQLQLSDSTFPVGAFSFSGTLEAAAAEGVVNDAATLERFARSAALQAALCDGVAALLAHRAGLAGDFDRLVKIDRRLMCSKMNRESRLMLSRMGKKMAELTIRLFPASALAERWLEAVGAGSTPGTYPVAQGLAFVLAGIGPAELFCSHLYGAVNMVLSAALRCVRVSHYDTQLILKRVMADVDDLYSRAAAMGLDDLNSFVPEIDILASLHEKGTMRMFMN